ncbi:hypothetical protein [Paenibacillus taichungensis]
MQVIDVIIELLETGRKLFGNGQGDEIGNSLGNENEALLKFVNAINQIVGYDRSEAIYAYFEGKINQKNAILRLVVDEPKEPLTEWLKNIVIPEPKKPHGAEVISIRSKRGRKDTYCEASCIEALRKASESLGSRFSRTAYDHFTKAHEGLPSAATVVKHIGKDKSSWKNILSTAGLERNTLKVAK